MTILNELKGVASAFWRKLVSLARELNRALAEPDHLEPETVKRKRDESVFQPRKY